MLPAPLDASLSRPLSLSDRSPIPTTVPFIATTLIDIQLELTLNKHDNIYLFTSAKRARSNISPLG